MALTRASTAAGSPPSGAPTARDRSRAIASRSAEKRRRRVDTDITSASCPAPPLNRLPRLAPSGASSPARPVRATARRSSSAAQEGRLQTMTCPVSFSYQRNAGTSSLLPWRMASWLAPVWLLQSVVHGTRRWLPSSHSATVSIAGRRRRPLRVPGRTASRSTSCPTPSSWTKTKPGSRVPSARSVSFPAPLRRPARRARRRPYAASSRMASVVLVADEAADITAAITTAVAGAMSPCQSGVKRSASSSSEPLRKNTSRPSTSAGTSSTARTSTGQTSALSRPKAPAAAAAVTAMRVGLSPVGDWMRKSGRIPASTAIVAVDTAHTTSTRTIAPPAARHRRSTPTLSSRLLTPAAVRQVRPRPMSVHGPEHEYPQTVTVSPALRGAPGAHVGHAGA